MKIGIDCRLWNETGVGRYIRNLVFQLQSLDKKSEYVLFVKNGFKINDLGFRNEKWKIVETKVHWHSISEQIKFSQILKKENLDLVHFPYFSHPISYNKPFVITIHDLIVNHFPTGKASTLPYPLYFLKRIGYSFVMEHAINNSQKVIVPLNSVKEDIIRIYNIDEDKIVVTYEGVDTSSLRAKRSNLINKKIASSSFDKLRAPRNDAYFLYVGNAYPHKNLEFLIKAFAEFKKEIKDDIKLVIVGKDDYFYKRFRDKIIKEKIENIIFKHDVSDEELFMLYSNAIAFVSASKMEGFGLPPLEAVSASCLVLLSDIEAFREVCKDAAIYFDLNSINSLKEKMLDVYRLNKIEKEAYLKKGLSRVKDFSWKKMAEETLKVYKISNI